MYLSRNNSKLHYGGVQGLFRGDTDKETIYYDWITYDNYEFNNYQYKYLRQELRGKIIYPVSYTHLTLPTIYSV